MLMDENTQLMPKWYYLWVYLGMCDSAGDFINNIFSWNYLYISIILDIARNYIIKKI